MSYWTTPQSPPLPSPPPSPPSPPPGPAPVEAFSVFLYAIYLPGDINATAVTSQPLNASLQLQTLPVASYGQDCSPSPCNCGTDPASGLQVCATCFASGQCGPPPPTCSSAGVVGAFPSCSASGSPAASGGVSPARVLGGSAPDLLVANLTLCPGQTLFAATCKLPGAGPLVPSTAAYGGTTVYEDTALGLFSSGMMIAFNDDYTDAPSVLNAAHPANQLLCSSGLSLLIYPVPATSPSAAYSLRATCGASTAANTSAAALGVAAGTAAGMHPAWGPLNASGTMASLFSGPSNSPVGCAATVVFVVDGPASCSSVQQLQAPPPGPPPPLAMPPPSPPPPLPGWSSKRTALPFATAGALMAAHASSALLSTPGNLTTCVPVQSTAPTLTPAPAAWVGSPPPAAAPGASIVGSPLYVALGWLNADGSTSTSTLGSFFNLSCPGASFISSLSGNAGGGNNFFSASCSDGTSFPGVGGINSGGSPYSFSCPTGMSSWTAYYGDTRVGGWINWATNCASSGASISVGDAAPRTPSATFNCPSGWVVYQVTGYIGIILNSIQVQCQPLPAAAGRRTLRSLLPLSHRRAASLLARRSVATTAAPPTPPPPPNPPPPLPPAKSPPPSPSPPLAPYAPAAPPAVGLLPPSHPRISTVCLTTSSNE